jgi:hypothetical protein
MVCSRAGDAKSSSVFSQEEMMRRWLLLIAIGGLLNSGCYSESPSTTASSNNGSAKGDPHADLTPADGVAESAAGQSLDDSGGPVALDAMVLTTPAGWQRKRPSSSFVVAELALPHAEGDDDDARLTVSTAGGSVEANVDRWKTQFDPLTEEKPLETIDVAGMSVTLVDLSGDFNDARGPFAPAVQRPGYRMIAAIVPIEGQLHFIKATGPKKTMATHAEAIQEFIRSVRPVR